MLTTLIRDIGSFFFQTKKQLSSNNVMNRKYIINPNEIVFMCFHKRPLVLCYAFKLCKRYNLFQSFFYTILYRFTVQNLVMCKFTYSCHLVFPCKSWLCIWLVNWNLKEFSVSVIIIDWLKNVPFFSQLSTQNTRKCKLGFWNFKIFWRSMPSSPPRRKQMDLVRYSGLLYSHLLATLIVAETLGFHRGRGPLILWAWPWIRLNTIMGNRVPYFHS